MIILKMFKTKESLNYCYVILFEVSIQWHNQWIIMDYYLFLNRMPTCSSPIGLQPQSLHSPKPCPHFPSGQEWQPQVRVHIVTS